MRRQYVQEKVVHSLLFFKACNTESGESFWLTGWIISLCCFTFMGFVCPQKMCFISCVSSKCDWPKQTGALIFLLAFYVICKKRKYFFKLTNIFVHKKEKMRGKGVNMSFSTAGTRWLFVCFFQRSNSLLANRKNIGLAFHVSKLTCQPICAICSDSI